MKITLLMAASEEYWSLMELSGPNKMEYCLRHKVQLAMAVHDRIGSDGNWGQRPQFMLDALDSYDPDWLWFMGADTLITNMKIDIRKLCTLNKDFIIGVDVHGINNDSFLLQNNKASRDFLKRILCRHDMPTDQHAMHFEKGVNLRTSLVPQRLFNSYKYDEYQYGEQPKGTWRPEDFVIHFPGMPNERRIALMTEYLGKVVR